MYIGISNAWYNIIWVSILIVLYTIFGIYFHLKNTIIIRGLWKSLITLVPELIPVKPMITILSYFTLGILPGAWYIYVLWFQGKGKETNQEVIHNNLN